MKRRKRFWIIIILFCVALSPLALLYYQLFSELQKNEEYDAPIQSNQPDILYNNSDCSMFPSDVSVTHPDCFKKMQWIRNGWKSHRCYADNHVNGSVCSFRYYLSNVESYCPLMDRTKNQNQNQKNMMEYARINTNMDNIISMIENEVPQYMKTRIQTLWKSWAKGAEKVMEEYKKTMEKRKKLNILIFIGFLAQEKKLKLAKKSDNGGPLGEFLQWSDLITSLSIIGHQLHLSTNTETLTGIVEKYTSYGPCQYTNGTRQKLDIIFTDIMGLNLIRTRHRMFHIHNKCRIRLLDSFGTHAEFATKSYFLQHKSELSGRYSNRNPWGGHQLDLRQHWTFYPHSHDNTFLGFVIDDMSIGRKKRRNGRMKSLVYGKQQYMWNGTEGAVSILKEMTEVHSTVADIQQQSTDSVFSGIINHGFLLSNQISQLLDDIDIFFGLGFPLEGPAPLEAIAHGAVFINAKFKEPKTRKNYPFLSEKPTLREWTSQCPYMEMIGEPHVITVDIDNHEELREAIERAKDMRPDGMIPEEFTTKGMLLRVAQLVEKQEFCDTVSDDKRWPPIKEMKIIKGNGITRESCEMACWSNGLMCEPSYFPLINNRLILSRELGVCPDGIRLESSPIAPFNCTLQSSSNLFSCASRPSKVGINRLCGCRDILPQQHALCTKCL